MRIEKVPKGYLLTREGEGGIEIWRKFNGAESMACDAIDELIAERDALRAKIEQMERQEPVAEIGQQYTLLFAGSGSITGVVKRHGIKIGDKLYALPGAQTQGEGK